MSTPTTQDSWFLLPAISVLVFLSASSWFTALRIQQQLTHIEQRLSAIGEQALVLLPEQERK